MKKKILNILRVFFYVLPILLGIWGFYFVAGESFLDAIFNTVLMYVLGYGDHPVNIYVELARWIAPAVTASWFVILIYSIRDRLIHFFLFISGKSIAIYGPDEEKEPLLHDIKKYVIHGKSDFIPASKYILLNDEENNFAFFASNKEKLKNAPVYLRSQTLPANAVCDSNLHLFCPEETSARLFWKKYFLYPVSQLKNHQLNIVMIGFDKLGEDLLLFGLQNNIFSPDQKISYHIFGDGNRFQATHTELASIEDDIIFYSAPWYQHLPLINHADMVVVVTQENQVELLRELLFATTREAIHVFVSNLTRTQLLSEQSRLQIFDWKAESQKLDYIMNDTLFSRAKRINLRYAHLYSNVEETEENKNIEWDALDTFTRYSNVSAADYHEVRLKMLETLGLSNADFLKSEAFELHSELEHIRWCRYHYLNNWKYGVPANGKNKDKTLRIHKDLIPYQELTDGEKDKDRENLRILHSI